jgi:ABC-type sulfate transport system permease component
MSTIRNPRWFWIPARVLLFTFLCSLLAFAVSLLLGILGVIVGARLRSDTPNITIAYREIALPAALMVAGIVLVSTVFMEVRHYRQSKALAEIARSSSPGGYAKRSPGI